ncbi:MAG: RHS repeat-associated core domain-containing protein [Gemmatimonadaceae bacterium]
MRIVTPKRPALPLLSIPNLLIPSLLALLLILGLVVPRSALAQGEECEPWMIDCGGEPGDPNPPGVTILPSLTSYSGAGTTYTLAVTIEWCDDNTLAASTTSIVFRGQDVTSGFSYTPGSRTGCGAFATSTGTVTLQAGSNALSASIQDLHANVGSGSETYSYTQLIYGVAVTPMGGVDGQVVYFTPSAASSQTFTVQNTGNQSVTYNLAVTTCSGGAIASACSLSASSVSPAAGTSAQVSVTFTSGALGSSGEIRITATQSGSPSVTDAGWVTPVVGTPRAPTVAVAGLSADTLVERDLCLTMAAGADAASECGDLRLAHALPSVRTLSKVRTLTLLYNSQHADPHPLVAANVTLPVGTLSPTTVRAVLRIGGVEWASSEWPGGEFVSGRTNRIVLGFAGSTLATGIYSYTIEVENRYANDPTRYATTQTGKFTVVNRASSPFGAGWWLAGLEQLDPATMLWVGGDGSVRQYRPTSIPNVWAAPAVDRPDTLKREGNYYFRYLPHGARVQFNVAGQHMATINRLGHTTFFSYETSGRLAAVSTPPATPSEQCTGGVCQYGIVLSHHVYVFGYTDGKLASVRTTSTIVVSGVPVDPILERTVTVTVSGGRLTAFQDPDNTIVSFGYSGSTNRIVTRIDRRQTVTTYAYDGGWKLAQASIGMGTGQADLVTRFRALESRGLAGSGVLPTAPDTALAYTLLDGPRADVGDSTRFWLDRFGSPRRVVNALGQETVLTRGDTRFPALVTELRAANGFVARAAYDDRGNVLTSTAVNPYDETPARDAAITYEWNRTYDFVTKVTLPQGEATTFDYDPATGNRLWQQVGPDLARRVYFSYTDLGLLRATQTPLSPRDSIAYDGVGNTVGVRTPLGFWTLYHSDAVGRDTLIKSPVDSAQTKWHEQRIAYDLMDRVIRTTSFGPASPSSASATALVQSFYDPEGNLDSLFRWPEPDPNAIGVIKTRSHYDRMSRKIVDVAADGRADTLVYDPAGSVVEHRTRRGDRIVMAYDALDRLTQRIVPAVSYRDTTSRLGSTRYPLYPNCNSTWLCISGDTVTITYDVVGNVLTADNRDARIRRTYNANGTLATDTLWIRTYAELNAGGNFTTHVYGLRFGYDLNGRRVWLKHPTSVAPRALTGTAMYDSTAYRYDLIIGQLAAVRDVLGNEFRYVYDVEGRPDTLYSPGDIFEKRAYDTDSRLVARVQRNNSTVGSLIAHESSLMRQEALELDIRGKVLRATNPVGMRDTVTSTYSGLGMLSSSAGVYNFRDVFGDPARQTIDDRWVWDALGNVDTSQTLNRTVGRTFESSSDHTSLMSYVSGTERIRTGTLYDRAGNIYWTEKAAGSPGEENTASYYGADDRLRVVDRRATNAHLPAPGPGGAWQWGAFTEYRYDALGRRILLRSRNFCTGSRQLGAENLCRSGIRRTVWDGDQLLYEIQYDGEVGVSAAALEYDTVTVRPSGEFWGRVAYTHGAELDRPLNAIRVGYGHSNDGTYEGWEPLSVTPHWHWRGSPDMGSFDDGAKRRCKTVSAGDYSRCVKIGWPQGMSAFQQSLYTPVSWFGSLLEQGAEASGLTYMRNRYYDPKTGRFTQEDPIGLAGGLNLYGFANGDPINFSDPFGLKPCPPNCPDDVDADDALAVFAQLDRMAPAVNKATAIFGAVSMAPVVVALGSEVVASHGGMTTLSLASRASALRIPTASNPALQRTIAALFRAGDRIPGGTAGAIRREAVTGRPVGGRWHLPKGIERIRNLERILAREKLSTGDRALAEQLLRDLRSAVRFAQEIARRAAR